MQKSVELSDADDQNLCRVVVSGDKEALAGRKDVRQFQQKRGLTAPRFDSETFGPRSSNSGQQTVI